MNNPFTEQRVSELEISSAQLKEAVYEVSRQMAQNSLETKENLAQLSQEMKSFKDEMAQHSLETKENLARLSLEMREFKDEMREFKDEMREFKDEMREFKDEMSEFKDEMSEFKNGVDEFKSEMAKNSLETRENLDRLSLEMREFKDEMAEFKEETRALNKRLAEQLEEDRKEQRRFNLKLGEIANRQGRMAEDLVAPSICRIMKEALDIDDREGCIPNIRVIRAFKGDRSKTREFDVIAECREYVLVNETKSSLSAKDVDSLLLTISEVRDYFPEFHDRKIIGAVASLHIDTSVVNYATGKGVLALAVGDELMDIQNPPGFKLAIW